MQAIDHVGVSGKKAHFCLLAQSRPSRHSDADGAAQRLGDAFKKLDALDQAPPSAEEVQSEIDAARAERRAHHADRR